MIQDRIGNNIHEGDLVEFKLPDDYQLVVATVENVSEGSVIAAAGPQGMKMPPKIILHIDIRCNLLDLTNSGIFRQVVVVKNPKQNEPVANA